MVERGGWIGGTGAKGVGWSAETMVDQALIRGLGTAFRVFVSGLVLCLEGGRRAQPGHVALMSVVDRKSVGQGKSVDLGGRGIIKKKRLLHRAGDGGLKRRMIKLVSA